MTYDYRITIYGAYDPDIVIRRLRIVRDYLRKNGYPNTILVQDYPDKLLPPEIQALRNTSILRFNFRKSIQLTTFS